MIDTSPQPGPESRGQPMTLTEIADAVERAGLEIVSRNEHGWRVVGQTQEALVRFDNRPDPDPRDGDPPYVEPFFFLKGLTNDDVRQRNPLTIVQAEQLAGIRPLTARGAAPDVGEEQARICTSPDELQSRLAKLQVPLDQELGKLIGRSEQEILEVLEPIRFPRGRS